MKNTIILHDGRELKINGGLDKFEFYCVGDHVNWAYSKYTPGQGHLLDDVYASTCNGKDDDWVIIKDHKIVAVEPWRKNYGHDDYGLLLEKYDITDPPRENWPEAQWLEYEAQQLELKKEGEAFLKAIADLPEIQKAAMLIARPLMKKSNYYKLLEMLKDDSNEE